jgi:acetoin utilization deacetylase AcuC-like enzyme
MNKHLFLSDYHLFEHDTGDHPENAERLQAIMEALKNGPYEKYLDLTKKRLATKEELILVHDRSYVDKILSLDGQAAEIDRETLVSPRSVKAARLAAGLGLELVEQVILGNVLNGFALLRPPGHHARPSTGMGFCIFNNIAIAAKKALKMGLKRILIFDWDVHHGNGTQEIFYNDDRILFVDIHQENLFPVNSGLIEEIGEGKGIKFTMNVPLPPECGDAEYLYIFDELVKQVVVEYHPELILVSAGFDAHESDPLGFMKVTTNGFGLLANRIKHLAELFCKGKLVFFLEGGYNPFFLSKNVLQCVKSLTENKLEPLNKNKPPARFVNEIIEKIYAARFK